MGRKVCGEEPKEVLHLLWGVHSRIRRGMSAMWEENRADKKKGKERS